MKSYGQDWADAIERSDDLEEWIPFVCEIPAGSPHKYALDKRSGLLRIHRALAGDLVYPTNYGFVPRTYEANDGMELDVLALSGRPLAPLCVARVRVLGGLTIRSSDREGHEDKLVAAVVGDPRCVGLRELADLEPARRADIDAFYRAYKQDLGGTVEVTGWFDRAAALAKLQHAFKARKKHGAARAA